MQVHHGRPPASRRHRPRRRSAEASLEFCSPQGVTAPVRAAVIMVFAMRYSPFACVLSFSCAKFMPTYFFPVYYPDFPVIRPGTPLRFPPSFRGSGCSLSASPVADRQHTAPRFARFPSFPPSFFWHAVCISSFRKTYRTLCFPKSKEEFYVQTSSDRRHTAVLPYAVPRKGPWPALTPSTGRLRCSAAFWTGSRSWIPVRSPT